MAMEQKRVAIVGSGCAGIGALWALKFTNHDVHLFEADEVLGGHTNTVMFNREGKETRVDTGFIVYNTATYPNFMKFLDNLGVETVPTQMTFGVSRDNGAFEWAGTSLSGIFAQWTNIFSPRMWRMLFDIVRFNQYALDLLDEDDQTNYDDNFVYSNGTAQAQASKDNSNVAKPAHLLSIGDYLEQNGYSDGFRDDYILPMAAAVWSTDAHKVSLQFPAITLIRFMWNHHLLNTVAARAPWRTIKQCSKAYIDAVLKDFPRDHIHLRRPVIGIEDINGKIILQFEDGDEDLFDHVILACHGDQAMEIIRDGGTQDERDILGAFKTSENVAYLHSDLKYMPRKKAAWSAWNLLTSTSSDKKSSSSPALTPSSVCLTYNMNILQHIPTSTFGDVLVTLNPSPPPARSTVQGQWTYNHPLYNPAAIRSQKELSRIQNKRGISYAGAWTKYGFHEDGFSSGLRVAIEHLGAVLPFDFVDSTFSRGFKPRLGLGDWLARLSIWYIKLLIMLVEFFFGIVFWPLGVGRYSAGMRHKID